MGNSISVVEPISLATFAWSYITADAADYNWPEHILDLAWKYAFKLSEQSSGNPSVDRAEIDDLAMKLNSAERNWTRVKRVHIARAVRDKVNMTCKSRHIADNSNHKIFTSGLLAHSN